MNDWTYIIAKSDLTGYTTGLEVIMKFLKLSTVCDVYVLIFFLYLVYSDALHSTEYTKTKAEEGWKWKAQGHVPARQNAEGSENDKLKTSLGKGM